MAWSQSSKAVENATENASRQLLNQCRLGVMGQERVSKLLQEIKRKETADLMDVTNFKNKDGWTALMHACNTNAEPSARALLENGASKCINATISDAYSSFAGFTALHFAAQCCDTTSLLTLLCEFGADVNIPTMTDKDSPLHILARRMKSQPDSEHLSECASILMEYGAYCRLRNRRGETPISLCSRLNEYGELECEEPPTFRIDNPPVYPSLEDLQPRDNVVEPDDQPRVKQYRATDMFLSERHSRTKSAILSPRMTPRAKSARTSPRILPHVVSDGSLYAVTQHTILDELDLELLSRQPVTAKQPAYKRPSRRVTNLEQDLVKEQKKADQYFELYQQGKMEANSLTFKINSLSHSLEEERARREALEEKVSELTRDNEHIREKLREARKKLSEVVRGRGRSNASVSSSNETEHTSTNPGAEIQYHDPDQARFLCSAKWPRPRGRGLRAFKKDKYVRAFVVADDHGFELTNAENPQDTFVRIWKQVSTLSVEDTVLAVGLSTNDRVKMNFPDRETLETFRRKFTAHFSVAESLGSLT